MLVAIFKNQTMKYILLIFTFFLTLGCTEQETKQNNFLLTVSPTIDQTNQTNKAIIDTLSDFLKTKNVSLTENKNWVQSDFQKYMYPYLDIYNIENSMHGEGFYRPTLVEIISTENPNLKL